MANFESVPKKRKLDPLEDETQFSSKKKIKAEKNRYGEDNISFSDLPPEIVHFILSFITNDTQRRHIRSVCQKWFDYINYSEFKIGLLLTSEVDEFSRCFGRYQKPIGLKFMRAGRIYNTRETRNGIRSTQMVQSMLSSLTQLTALDLQLKDFEIPQELVNLKALTVISPIHGDTLSRLTNLRRLKTASRLTEIPTTLESLDLWDSADYELFNNKQANAAIYSTYSRLTELVMLMESRCEIPDALTNLRKLSVFESGDIDLTQMNLRKFPYLEEFITTSGMLPIHRPSTLTKLNVFSSRSVEITEDLTQLKELYCSSAKFHNLPMNFIEGCVVHNDNETLLALLDPQKVTKLNTTLTTENCHVLSRFTHLINLDISLDRANLDTMPYFIPLTSLTILNLYYDIYPHQWLRELTNLVDLQLEKAQAPESEPINFEMMQQLTSLELIGNYKSIINIINLTNLLHLRIYNQKNSRAPNTITIHGLSTATNLTSLSVKHLSLRGSSKIDQSTELALLTNLRMLELDRSSNAEILNIADLMTLQHLTFLQGRVLNDSVWYLTRLTRLQIISISTYNPDSVDYSGVYEVLPFCYRFEEL